MLDWSPCSTRLHHERHTESSVEGVAALWCLSSPSLSLPSKSDECRGKAVMVYVIDTVGYYSAGNKDESISFASS